MSHKVLPVELRIAFNINTPLDLQSFDQFSRYIVTVTSRPNTTSSHKFNILKLAKQHIVTMVPRVLTLVVCFLLQAIARAYTAQVPFRTTEDENGCPTGIHVVGVRGTLEKPGFGAMQPLVDKLLADIPDSDSFAIDYPAAGIIIEDDKPIYQPLEYIHSVKAGRKKLSAELIDFTSSCPNTSIVLMSYSQASRAELHLRKLY